MKQTLKTIIRKVKRINGNSLAEFATTTALMATLAATAAPKLSEMSEGAMAEKSRNEIDKIIKQAGMYYQEIAETEGRGRFPGQSKFNVSVGGPGGTEYSNDDASGTGINEAIARCIAHEWSILTDLADPWTANFGNQQADGWEDYDQAHSNGWVSVFGTTKDGATLPAGVTGVTDNAIGQEDWREKCFGYEILISPFQDGHYVYSVIAGFGSGDSVFPPILYVGDIENMTDFNNVLLP